MLHGLTLLASRPRLNSRLKFLPSFPHTWSVRPSRHIAFGSRSTNTSPLIEDDFAALKENYDAPKNAIVLAHGLLGFDELRLAGQYLPGIQYWRGIREAMMAKGIKVIIATVPASASIQIRAQELRADIAAGAAGRNVNIIAGLDSRYLISQIKHNDFRVASLTTVASPHRGSSFADYIFREIGDSRLPGVYRAFQTMQIDTGAFAQLTRKYMTESFNPANPDDPLVRYFSYGAIFEPSLFSPFRHPHSIIFREEGPNDGLVSVSSSTWGGQGSYKGTLVGVSHLDLINWTNRLKAGVARMIGQKARFNAIAFYLGIADMLAKEGL